MSSSEEIWICSVRIRWLGEAYFLLFNWYWNRAIENRYWTFKLELLDLKLISTHMSPSVFYFDLGNGGSAKNQKPVDNQNKCFRLNVRSVKITREQWAEAACRWCSIGRNNLLEIGLRYQFRLAEVEDVAGRRRAWLAEKESPRNTKSRMSEQTWKKACDKP